MMQEEASRARKQGAQKKLRFLILLLLLLLLEHLRLPLHSPENSADWRC
jgi:hypothetical protein